MRAIYYQRTGRAAEVLQLGELPTPEPEPGEVRVRLAWSGVNPSDVKTRAGLRSNQLPFPTIVPHSDGAGVIDEVGPGVDRNRIGQRVWVWNAAWGRAYGTAAEYVTLPDQQAVALPDSVGLDAAACLGIPALTAYHAVVANGGVAGKSVLVAGGAGAVAHYAIQIARRLGAERIFSTVSGPQKATVATEAGADEVINYRTENVATRIGELTGEQGVDRIIEVDLAGNIGLDLAVIKQDGQIVTYGSNAGEISLPFFPAIVKNAQLQFYIVYNLNPVDRAAAVNGVTELLQRAMLTHNIAARLPLERTAEAHELVEQGRVIGNVVIELDTLGSTQ